MRALTMNQWSDKVYIKYTDHKAEMNNETGCYKGPCLHSCNKK